MRRLLKEELGRGFGGIGFRISLLMGGMIAITHVIQYGISNHILLLSMDYDNNSLLYPLTVIENWLAGNSYNLQSFVYFLLFPLLAVIPYGISYFDDRKKGVLHNIFTRCPRRQYLISKFLVTFLSGGAAVIIPLLLNLLVTMMILPNLIPQSILPGNGINAAKWGYMLYFQNPAGYLAVYLLIDFVFGGLYAVFALAGSFFLKHKIAVAMSSFFLQLFLYVVCSVFEIYEYSSVYFLQAGYGVTSLSFVISYALVLGVTSFFVFIIAGEKQDVY